MWNKYDTEFAKRIYQRHYSLSSLANDNASCCRGECRRRWRVEWEFELNSGKWRLASFVD